MDRINFTGGFLLPKTKPETWEKIYTEIVPKRRNIQYDLFSQGDVFFSTKTCYDSDILKYFIKNKIAFKFFPKINLKTRLDSYYPEETRRILSEQKEIYTHKDDLSKYIITPKPPKYEWRQGDYIDNTFKYVGVDKSNFKIQTTNGITNVYDMQNRLVASISPYNNNGENFIISYSRYSDDQLRMTILNYKGEKIDETTDINKLKRFRQRFLKAVETEKERLKTTK